MHCCVGMYMCVCMYVLKADVCVCVGGGMRACTVV